MDKKDEGIQHRALNIADKTRRILNEPLSFTEQYSLLSSILLNAGDILQFLE